LDSKGPLEIERKNPQNVRKSKRKQKIEMFVRRVTTLLSLKNYMLPQKMYAKGYSKYFFMIQ
jgi:hypothetical protein